MINLMSILLLDSIALNVIACFLQLFFPVTYLIIYFLFEGVVLMICKQETSGRVIFMLYIP